jgi:pyruvate,orthophosphate dikinase
MFGNVVRDVPGDRFEEEIARMKERQGATLDTDLDADALRELTHAFQGFYDFPHDPAEQLESAIRAVFDSWSGERAVAYRRINEIPDHWGTAVNVQQMVFGNKGETSGSGVAFSRDAITGAPEPSGDFLPNAQGEDVVAGVRNTRELIDLRDWMPAAHERLLEIMRTLEAHYGDMQDVEFTIEDGRLFMLQTRSAKRPARAAVRFAVDAVDEGLLTREQALATIDASRLDALLHATFDPVADYDILTRGVAASPGAAKGRVVFTAEEAITASHDVILVRQFTQADDVAGFHAAKGVLTSEGGKASHAALVARGMGVPAVTGATALSIDTHAREARVGDVVLRAGDFVAIDGSTGAVTTEDVSLVEPEVDTHLETVLAWCDSLRRLRVRANADTPEDARRARSFGAEGIGLCRTEHMFLGERQPLMAEVILAADEETRRGCLDRLLPLQQRDFEGLFEAMRGLPVTIRLLDVPMHEFLPHHWELDGGRERERVRGLAESNPMLGTRGVRLALLHPEIYEMQVTAICRAAKVVTPTPLVEIMVPLVGYVREFELMRELVVRVAREEELEHARDYTVGTMIELPRACFVADEIATMADFFSFGTNDLTQTTLGFSRDDVEGRILDRYVERRVLERSPFETLDTRVVGRLLRMAGWLGRDAHRGLGLGVCGEHGGDPDSIDFLHHSGVDYVSCSAYRVPIARMAAAQAAIAAMDESPSLRCA